MLWYRYLCLVCVLETGCLLFCRKVSGALTQQGQHLLVAGCNAGLPLGSACASMLQQGCQILQTSFTSHVQGCGGQRIALHADYQVIGLCVLFWTGVYTLPL